MYRDRNRYANNKTNLTKVFVITTHVVRILLAAVFIFSGFVKAVDPLGFTYKIQDYFEAFGGFFLHLDFLAFPAAIAQSTIELLIGLNLLFAIQLRRTSYLAFIVMLVMTPLTLYIALNNPVTDCGCFGDALIITNWQTFYKNIVLITLVIILMITNKSVRPLLLPHVEWIIVGIFILTGVGISLYSYDHLPLIDFRPYKVGVNIPEAMKVPANAPMDKYKTTFIYEKNGVKKEFTLQNYPKGDSTWKFVDQKSVLISRGYQPPIHDFAIEDSNFNDITDNVINYPGYTYLLIMYDLDNTSIEGAKRGEAIYKKYKNTNTHFYALTASGDESILEFIKRTGIVLPFCKSDPITLKTIIRANPGLVLIKNGTIIGKWNWRDF